MEKLYIRVGNPDYKEFEEHPEFCHHSQYCVETDEYFVEYQWAFKNKKVNTSDIVDKALSYLRAQVDALDVHEAMNKMDKCRCSLEVASPSLYSQVRDCLDTFGEENDLPELWYDECGGIDDFVFNL